MGTILFALILVVGGFGLALFLGIYLGKDSSRKPSAIDSAAAEEPIHKAIKAS